MQGLSTCCLWGVIRGKQMMCSSLLISAYFLTFTTSREDEKSSRQYSSLCDLSR